MGALLFVIIEPHPRLKAQLFNRRRARIEVLMLAGGIAYTLACAALVLWRLL